MISVLNKSNSMLYFAMSLSIFSFIGYYDTVPLQFVRDFRD